MTKVGAQRHIMDPVFDGNSVLVHPASRESVDLVLSRSEDDPNGRSNWLWVRLPNGDLILGVFPQGDTYEMVERDAFPPGL